MRSMPVQYNTTAGSICTVKKWKRDGGPTWRPCDKSLAALSEIKWARYATTSSPKRSRKFFGARNLRMMKRMMFRSMATPASPKHTIDIVENNCNILEGSCSLLAPRPCKRRPRPSQEPGSSSSSSSCPVASSPKRRDATVSSRKVQGMPPISTKPSWRRARLKLQSIRWSGSLTTIDQPATLSFTEKPLSLPEIAMWKSASSKRKS
mmetsp:Transcript_55246/g.167950  ORF Transcript_55246/g.167950 Transcript_55246/m.167950 type:complete len:207 (+) Transcript_55246:256-876(+)